MKATLEFTDGFEFRCAINGRNMLLVLNALDREMRNDTKYHDGWRDTDHWRDRLRRLAEDYHVDLEDDYDF